MGMRGEVGVGSVEEDSVKAKSRAERGILSCTRLQLFCATQWLRRGRLPSSRRVHWYDSRVIRRRVYMSRRSEMFGRGMLGKKVAARWRRWLARVEG